MSISQGNSDEELSLTPSSSKFSTFYMSSESSTAKSAMSEDSFSMSTKAQIKQASAGRCVSCLRNLGDGGHCAPILDSSKLGSVMLQFAIERGLLPATYQRSSSENGLAMCASCHLEFFTPNLVVLSPTREVLTYLIKCFKSNICIPIHEILQRLIDENDTSLPNVSSVKPFLGLYILAPLDPTTLKTIDFATFNDPEISQLTNGVWTPGGDHAPSQVTGKICDATAIPCEARGQLARIDLSIIPEENQYYWRTPTAIAPILAYLLFQVSTLPRSDCIEVELAKYLLTILNQRISPVRDVIVRDSPPDPGVGDSKRQRNDDDDDDRGPRKSRSVKAKLGRKKGGKPSINQVKKMGASLSLKRHRFNKNMTSNAIIFAARGIVLW